MSHPKPSIMTNDRTMQALTLDAEHKIAHLQTHAIPTPGPGELLIKVRAIALNPVDALYTANPLGSTGRIVGSDFAGTVVESNFAERSATSVFEKGERVAGFVQGACSVNERPGAFAEFVVCPADLVWRIPAGMAFEQAASVSLCGLTAAQAVFGRLELSLPWAIDEQSTPDTIRDEERCFLIYGASTSVALYAAQLVRASAARTSTLR